MPHSKLKDYKIIMAHQRMNACKNHIMHGDNVNNAWFTTKVSREVCLNKHKTTDMLILNMKGRSALIGSRILMQDNNKNIVRIK